MSLLETLLEKVGEREKFGRQGPRDIRKRVVGFDPYPFLCARPIPPVPADSMASRSGLV